MSPVLYLVVGLARAGEGRPSDAGSATLADDTEDDRPSDEELFGEAPPPPSGAPTDAPPAESVPPTETPLDAGEVGPMMSDAAIAGTLAQADQRLAIGGQLYLRGTAAVTEDREAADVDWSAPALLDVYLDARPNDRVRAYARGRLSQDFSILDGETDYFGNELSATTVAVDQVWLKFDVARRVYTTLGRQRIKWGSGRFWNPTDFLNQQNLDPLQTYDLRTGVALAKVHLPIEKTGTNVYAIADLDEVGTLGTIGAAGRVEQVVGLTEVALSASAQEDQPLRLGVDVSTGLWIFDLHAEAAVRHGDTTPYWTGDYDLATLTAPTEVDRSDDWIPQVVAGLEIPIRYSDLGTMYVGGEVFWNDAGYDDASLYPWLALNGQLTPFYLGKLYGSAYLYLPGAARLSDHSVTVSWLGNLSDQSHVVRADYRVTVLTRLQVSASANVHLGGPGEFRLTFEEPALGIDVPAPIVDIGVGALLTF